MTEILIPTAALRSDIEALKALSQLDVGVSLKVYGFTFTLVRREQDLHRWYETMDFIKERLNPACRWSISRDHIIETRDYYNVVVLVTHKAEERPGVPYKPAETLLSSFSAGLIEENSGYIGLTCGRTFESKIKGIETGNDNVDFKAGLVARCLLTNYMLRQGIREIYNYAATEGLISYYTTLGFRLGKESCGKEDAITELHEKYIQEGRSLEELLTALGPEYKIKPGYRMKLCSGIEGICLKAIATLRKFEDTLAKYNDVYWYGAIA